uniref:EGF-like domain-containing protein n=1 Tax=Aegilops tauschii subsp. strangulata TaxID=200361 RepID=A0A453MXT0_AEGTS
MLRHRLLRDARPHRPPLLPRGDQVAGLEQRVRRQAAHRGARRRERAVPAVLEFVVDSKPVVLPGVATSGCPVDARRSACRSSHASCRNVSGNYRSGYVCRCLDGYQGNPYLAGGCQDIDEFKCRHWSWQWSSPSNHGTWCYLGDPKDEATEGKNAQEEILQAKSRASVAAIGVSEGGHRREDDHPLGGATKGNKQF